MTHFLSSTLQVILQKYDLIKQEKKKEKRKKKCKHLQCDSGRLNHPRQDLDPNLNKIFIRRVNILQCFLFVLDLIIILVIRLLLLDYSAYYRQELL